MEYMPNMSGLTSGHDTENGMYNSIKVCTLYIVLSVRIGWFVVIAIAWGKQ